MDNFGIYQMQILCILAFQEEVRFTDLNVNKLTSDHFTYHLKKLLDEGFVERSDSEKYRLTVSGKNLVSSLDTYSLTQEVQPKAVVVAVCERNGKYLMQESLKHPMRNYFGLPGGKVKTGNDIYFEINRELEEETGLTGEPELKEIRHVIKKNKLTNEIITDDIIFCFKMKKLKGEMVDSVEGKNFWMTLEEIKKLEKILPNTINSIESASKKDLTFTEETQEY